MKNFIQCDFKPYEEQYISLHLKASNGLWMGSLDLYVDIISISKFSEELIDYDGTISTKSKFETGSKQPKWAYFISIEILPIDNSGHSKISFEIYKSPKSENEFFAKFDILCDPASINDLGRDIAHGIKYYSDFIWKPKS